MRDDLAASLSNVSKYYRLYDRPQERLKQSLFGRLGKSYGREFWALREVSFELARGESMGIIGQNGSGKSTLLQIVAGILPPNGGTVNIRGRVGALLELGSGFNPDFTGRENIYLNGSILGFSTAQIDGLFDDIAAFADIGQFIDQPVKLYSSGMFMRLAFAIATSMNPDILVVDEALSVGDTRFQHKCMRRIKQMMDDGMSVLLVSHTGDVIKRFCNRAVWLEQGECRYFGESGVAVEKYLAFLRMRDQGITCINIASLDEPSDDSPNGSDALALPGETQLPLLETLDFTRAMPLLRGNWQLKRIVEDGRLAQMTGECGAAAGFRFAGDWIELSFLHHAWSGSVQIVVDGREAWVDLYEPKGMVARSVKFSLGSGEHSIYLVNGPAKHDHADQMWWLGGTLEAAVAKLEFKRNPDVDRIAGEVGRYGNGKGRLTAVELLDYATGEPVHEAAFGQKVRLRLHAELLREAGPRIDFSFIVRDRNRIDLFGTTTFDEDVRLDPKMTRFVAEFVFTVTLGPGSYSILSSFVECSEDLSQKVVIDQIDITYVFSVAFNPKRPVWYIFHQPIDVHAHVE